MPVMAPAIVVRLFDNLKNNSIEVMLSGARNQAPALVAAIFYIDR